jgi:amino acid adenylation domain-containing protein
MLVNVLEYLESTFLRFSERTAVETESAKLSFSELCRLGLTYAREIRQRSPAAGEPVLVFLEKSPQAVASLVGALMSGGCYCPVDTRIPAVRVSAIVENLGAGAVISSRAFERQLLSAGVPAERLILVDDLQPAVVDNPWDEVHGYIAEVIDTDPAYIIYTSGSTGVPKGVTICHRSIIDYIEWARECYAIDEHEAIGSQSPFFFDNSTLDLYLCFSCGARLVLIPEHLFAFPAKLLEFVARTEMTFVFWVPSVLVNIANLKLLDGVDLPRLKKVLFAGEVMPVRPLRYWVEKLPGRMFSNLYGPTEITVDCTHYNVPIPFAEGDSLPIGVPCHNSACLILTEDGRAAGTDEVGELCIRGSSLALGYWKDFDKSAAVFQQNPLNTRYFDRMYRTGDLVTRRADGNIMYIGRKDNQIKHLGYRIELGDIEAAAERLPYVGRACAVYHTTKQEIRLFLSTLGEVRLAQLRGDLLKSLPKYMVPTGYHPLDELPMTPNGKVDRRRLSDSLQSDELPSLT